ncbi:MAG: SDR family NAD(P)-dependent oxidoreductase [bacterium]|nr:SDR family NAD(P)-dependent oxidoreductase [bacterium]
MRLKNKVIVVTGGASGIGRAAVRCCAREGASVAVVDMDAEGVAATVQEVKALGVEAAGFAVDVRDETQVRNMMEGVVAAFEKVDGLVHAAGILEGAFVPVDLFEEATWDRVLDVNLKGSFLVCKYAVPAIERAGAGVIVLISSGAGVSGGSSSVAYGSSKGGVHGLSLVLAAQLASRNIRVHGVCPGSIDTPLKRRQLEAGGRPFDPEKSGLGDPEGVGKLLSFLVSDEADYVRGTIFTR